MRPFSAIISVLVLLFIFNTSYSQTKKSTTTFSTSSLFYSESQAPFWLISNQLDRVPNSEKYFQLLDISHFNIPASTKNSISFLYGTQITGYLGKKTNDLFFTQLYAGLQHNMFVVKVGAWTDSLVMAGLSSSNGNLLNSQNARPYPKIGLSTNGFIKIGKKLFYISAALDETILKDERIIRNARLHHKKLFLRFGRIEKLQFTWGVEHYAFWGGSTLEGDNLPRGFSDYIRTFFSLHGDESYSQGDQINVVGNHLGQYQFILSKQYKTVNAEFRMSHPFEDFSGMGFINLRDNLYSLYLNLTENTLLTHLVVEYLYSMSQSGDDIRDGNYGHKKGTDNYFNHGTYRSGFTYEGRMMGSPFFNPVILNTANIPLGIGNNRIKAIHLGGSGNLVESIGWKLLGSYSQNFGTYGNPYEPFRKQFSGLAEFVYSAKKIPFNMALSLAYDKGSNLNSGTTTSVVGFKIQIEKTF